MKVVFVFMVAAFAATTTAFQISTPRAIGCPRTARTAPSRVVLASASPDETDTEEEKSTQKVEAFLQQKFPSFYSILSKNDDVFKILGESEKGYTLFAPNEEAFANLGDKKRQQLRDVRNEETAQKIGLYHVVSLDKLTATQLRTEDWKGPKPKNGSPRPFTVGGILTEGGEVPVGRSKSGGFLGWGAKEDGDAVIGPNARIVKSFTIGENEAIVHEVDAFISPELLWRYVDQLRIPGF